MPKKPVKDQDCQHLSLQLDSSRYAEEVYGYVQAAPDERAAAALPSGKPSERSSAASAPSNTSFPGALVLPEDELAWDPQYDTQSLQAWMRGKWRNAVTDKRKTLYVVPPPGADKDVRYINDSLKPKLDPKASNAVKEIDPPAVDEVTDYIRAFYHGLPSKVLQKPKLQFVEWNPLKSSRGASYIGLNIGGETIRIRTRPSKDGHFTHQLNLEDLLDAAIRLLPRDAYAIVLLVHHDLYENDEDDFCCGRAYGGSRVSVISTARYNPAFDEKLEVERVHAWPASHCAEYVETCCVEADVAAGVKPPRKKAKLATSKKSRPNQGAMGAAVEAYRAQPPASTPAELAKLWLGRVCKTTSHELGHCFGMDHCVYYACVMQGTTGLSEDARQPPYLCPVDFAKVLHATGAGQVERYRALLEICEKWDGDSLFVAFAAWLKARIEEIGKT